MVSDFFGLDVVASPMMPPPRDPTPGEWARRYVRNRLVELVGERIAGKPGPEPDRPVYTAYVIGGAIVCHPRSLSVIKIEGIE